MARRIEGRELRGGGRCLFFKQILVVSTMFESIERLRHDHRAQYIVYQASQLFNRHGLMSAN